MKFDPEYYTEVMAFVAAMIAGLVLIASFIGSLLLITKYIFLALVGTI